MVEAGKKNVAFAGGYAYQKLRQLGLTEDAARVQAKETKLVSLDTNATVWRKGAEVKTYNCIISGLVSAAVSTESSTQSPIAIYGEHTWFGEFSILNNKPAYADFVCLLPTEMLTLPAANINELINSEQNFAVKMAKMVSWRAQKTAEMLMIMKCGNPCLRVIMGISQFAESLAYYSDRPPTIGYGEGLTIPVKQEVLASLCGVSRTKLSEFVLQLERSGWLRISYGKIEILSLQTWHRFSALQRERRFSRLNPDIHELLIEMSGCDDF